MGNEEEITDVYEDYLDKQDDVYLLSQLLQSYKFKLEEIKNKVKDVPKYSLCDYERTQLISIIQNIDWTGELDSGFEDLRKSVSTNDSCG